MATATPDLTAILATLAQFAPPQDNSKGSHDTAGDVATPPIVGAASREKSVPRFIPDMEKPKDPRLRPQSQTSTASPKPMIDPATITTWQDGLRCVTKIAVQNAQFATCIKKVGLAILFTAVLIFELVDMVVDDGKSACA